ncbi:flagellar assembly protein FliW, partial [bacterium]|nr:flagellar assembly protein FliW [bacterium]
LLVFCIVTMSRDIQEVTVNLQGPLVINPKQKLGHQFVLVETEYTTREKLLRNADEQTSGQVVQNTISTSTKSEELVKKQAV